MSFYMWYYLPLAYFFDRAHRANKHLCGNTDKIHSVPEFDKGKDTKKIKINIQYR